MSQPFPEQVAPGGILVYPQIQSPDYVTGVSGWAIFRDGSVEFNNGVFRGQIIDGGMFVYSGTPGLGNPPVAWMTSASADPYGNTVEPLTGVRDPSTGQGVFLRSDQIVMLNSHTYAEPGASDAYFFAIPAAATSGQSQMYMMSPTDNQEQAMVQVLGQSEDLSEPPAVNFLVYNNFTAAVVEGMNIGVGQVTAYEPGTTTLETWHLITLDSGWTAGSPAPQYRLLPDGNVQLAGKATHASISTETALNSSHPIPASYRPASDKKVYQGNRAGGLTGAALDTTGIVYAEPSGTAATTIDLTGIVDLL